MSDPFDNIPTEAELQEALFELVREGKATYLGDGRFSMTEKGEREVEEWVEEPPSDDG